MDAIRQRQIAEILDENKTIGNMVFALEKRWVQSETDKCSTIFTIKCRSIGFNNTHN